MMCRARALAASLFVTVSAGAALAEDPNSYPDPYGPATPWGNLPAGRHFGQVIGVQPDRDGTSIWVFERCGDRYCPGTGIAPIDEFDAAGNLKRIIGEGLVVFPHGLWLDRDDNIWITDADAKDGKGSQVFKLSPDGKVLMTLGKAGVEGDGPDVFDRPTFALTAPNGDIFVADGHGKNDRIVKLAPDGTFIKAWGHHGGGPGEFAVPHSMALDARGRLFVADRSNNRVQIFDQDGNFLAAWKQFGRPSAVFIDQHDTLYVPDTESNEKTNPGFKRGIRIGSAEDGTVTAFVPDPTPYSPSATGVGAGTGPEGLGVDDAGNIFGGETTEKALVVFRKR